MEARYLDHYSYLNSPVHRVHASAKLAVALVMVLLILLIPLHWETFHIAVGLALLIVGLISRLPVLGMIARLRWMGLVVLTLSLGRLWQENGVYHFFSSLIKATECLLMMALVANTTRFSEIVQVLAALGTPRIILTTLSLMYRYLFVLSDEANRMRRARQARSFRTGKAWSWFLQSTVISHLFMRCTDRSERIHSAMSARGWE